jgi:hypothetical protein
LIAQFMNINLYLNLQIDELEQELKKNLIPEEIKQRITISNSRIEFVENNDFLFIIFYIPEYNKKTKAIDTVEINIIYHNNDKSVDIFANNSEYFFEKYSEEIKAISFKSFGTFLEKFLSLIFEDVSRIISHILGDTNEIRKEYLERADNYEVIRHLTHAQINISSLRLIFANQNKLIELVNDYMSKTQQSSLNYKKTYLEEELNYAKEFCETLMTSINTKFQVRTSDDLYRFNKYAFMTFVSTLSLTLLIIFRDDHLEGVSNYFLAGLWLVAASILFVLIFFRNKK